MKRRLGIAIVLVCLCLAGWAALGLLPPPSIFIVHDVDGPSVVVTPGPTVRPRASSARAAPKSIQAPPRGSRGSSR